MVHFNAVENAVFSYIQKEVMRKILLLIIVLFSSNLIGSETVIPRYGCVKGEKVIVRSGPSISSANNGFFSYGEIVECLEKSSEESRIGNHSFNWYKVKRKNDTVGWIYGRYLSFYNNKPKDFAYYVQAVGKKLGIKFKLDKKTDIMKSEDGRISLFSGNDGLMIVYVVMEEDYEVKYEHVVYKCDGDDLFELVRKRSRPCDYLIYKNYLIFLAPRYDNPVEKIGETFVDNYEGVIIFDLNTIVEKSKYNENSSKYKIVYELNGYEPKEREYFRFDENKMEIRVYRLIDNKLLKTLSFKDGAFF
jgi:hypothetical protein